MKLSLTAIAACVALSAPVAANASVVLPVLDPVLVDETFASIGFAQTARINFVNQLNYDVDLYWINYSGDRVFYQTIAAMNSYIQNTYITHPWLVIKGGTGDLTEGSGIRIAGFLAETPGAPRTDPDVAYIRSAVPEPAAWAALIAGFSIAGVSLRRRRAAA